MSASQHRYTCAELGMCQARAACMECEHRTVPVIRMINSRRVHTIDEPVPFQAVPPTPPTRPADPVERAVPTKTSIALTTVTLWILALLLTLLFFWPQVLVVLG